MTTAEMIAVMKAFEEGKKIQCLIANRWLDAENPSWDWFHYDFRVKPEEEKPVRMTNRQFMRWVRSNLGEVKDGRGIICNSITYQQGFEDEPIREDVRIRYWESDTWLIPTYDIYERDCKGVSK